MRRCESENVDDCHVWIILQVSILATHIPAPTALYKPWGQDLVLVASFLYYQHSQCLGLSTLYDLLRSALLEWSIVGQGAAEIAQWVKSLAVQTWSPELNSWNLWRKETPNS